jgi:ParB/RepB/Spo0J family partition protein
MENQVLVPLDLIDPNPYQPRQVEDTAAVAEIADSIARNGLMQVPTARQVNGHYQLAFGHTRLAAFRLNGEECMPLFIRELHDLQMFELGVAENIKRRDLNPIEQAQAMHRYMEEFGKNSTEAGEFFNVSPELVRQSVRLLNLPEPAQQKLAAGAITQTTARTLLSMQRIAPERVIVEMVKKIETNPGRLPEDVIENSIKRMDEVVDMWDDDRQGKPRSSYYNGWLLDMKNFPNKLLPQLTPVDIAIALGIQDDQELISHANTWYQIKTGDIDPEIEAPSEEGWVLTPEMMRLTPELVQKLEHLMNPPACTACPFYTKVHGSHYCGMKTCHTRKIVAWNTEALQQASKKLKIEIYQKSDGAYKVLDNGHQSLFKNRHKGLRLLPKELFKGYAYQYSYEGVDNDIFVVVATGDAMDKMGTASSRGGKKSEKERAEMRMMKVYRLRRKEMMWEFTAAACGMFDAVPEKVLKKLNMWNNILMDDDIPENVRRAGSKDENGDSNYQRRALVWRVIMGLSSHYRRESLRKQLTEFQELTQVKVSKALIDRIAEWDAEIEAAGKGVSAATSKGKR